jgi:SpoVK/Ycf46/Vps4 family AAA+-type ATPase
VQVRFDDIVGNDAIKLAIRRMLSVSKTANRLRLERFGIQSPRAVLLWGPPGNSKTRLAMAAANEYSLPLISLSCADVYSPYVGNKKFSLKRSETFF